MLQRKKDKTVYFGTECFSSLAPKIWKLLPGPLKNEICQNSFKPKIKFWVTDKCPCRLCKKYVGNVGFSYYWFYLILWQRHIQNPDIHLRWWFHLVKLVNGFQPLPISAKSSNLDIWHGSGYMSVLWAGLWRLATRKKNQIS